MFAHLPMYDFAEHREHTDALWLAIAERLRNRGIAAPARLARPAELPDDWLRPDLLLSQACGLPFARRLRGRVTLVGGADHRLPDCAPGSYRSRVVVRADERRETLAEFRGSVVAVNSEESQSGAGALRTAVAALPYPGPFFARALSTGAHVDSLKAVAEGRADIAAVDAVTFEMALRHRPEARALRVLLSTPETPGLPFVTRRGGPAEALCDAMAGAIQAVGTEAREALMLHGMVVRREEDFDGIAAADAAAMPLGPV